MLLLFKLNWVHQVLRRHYCLRAGGFIVPAFFTSLWIGLGVRRRQYGNLINFYLCQWRKNPPNHGSTQHKAVDSVWVTVCECDKIERDDVCVCVFYIVQCSHWVNHWKPLVISQWLRCLIVGLMGGVMQLTIIKTPAKGLVEVLHAGQRTWYCVMDCFTGTLDRLLIRGIDFV